MRLDPSTKKLLIVFGALLLVYAGIQTYNMVQEKKDYERYQAMMDKIYDENPGLKEEMEQQAELVRLYGPRALDADFNAGASSSTADNNSRKVEKLEDGSEKITIFYENGEPREEYIMKNNQLDGLFKFWDASGRLLEESEYQNNILNGIQKNFYTNGSIKNEITYVDGQKNGLAKNWYQDGKQSSEIEYKDNKVISSKSFYPNGALRMEETLNEATGILSTQAFYNNGTLSHSFDSIGNKKEGTLIKNAPTGFKVAEASYKNGVNDGWCRIWNEKGELDTELFYKDGQLDRSQKMTGNACIIDIWRFGFR
ncbi:toxin-antitoxin system YwqK family antitoxin [Wohlfahrtiimonas larvae]|uniref:Phophatidylinositol-4-phosphate 5-kinase n=1 Tax=Wohlfahrtiimonas larvae TaxID=1157986 RepID=A0ABP9MDJ7_9GAMM|nr:toxin-antitoxin system YwqK family antitoxin [Wohlfahrtiimonas larvae]